MQEGMGTRWWFPVRKILYEGKMIVLSMETLAPLKVRVFFWFILGSLSVFFAEVLSGSSPLAFFVPEGWFIIFPLYALHVIVLSSLVYMWGNARIETLFPAGMLLGMYEAYITKVLWYPPDVDFPKIGGVSLFSFPVLVLFWHPIMSFLIPVVLGEILLTRSRESIAGLPAWLISILEDPKRARKWVLGLSIMLGLLVGTQLKEPILSFISLFLSFLFVYLLIIVWRNIIGKRYTLRELLPGKKGFVCCLAMLLILYIILGGNMRFGYLPEVTAQLTVWIIYAFIIALFLTNIRLSRKKGAGEIVPRKIWFSKKWAILSILTLSTASGISALIWQIGWIFIIAVFVAGVALGIIFLYYSIAYPFHTSISKAMGA